MVERPTPSGRVCLQRRQRSPQSLQQGWVVEPEVLAVTLDQDPLHHAKSRLSGPDFRGHGAAAARYDLGGDPDQ
jgi:hypothetical protein